MDDGALSTSEMALSLVFDEENTSVVYADEEAARKSAEKNGKVETFSLAEALDGRRISSRARRPGRYIWSGLEKTKLNRQ